MLKKLFSPSDVWEAERLDSAWETLSVAQSVFCSKFWIQSEKITPITHSNNPV